MMIPMLPFTASRLQQLLDGLAANGFVIISDFLAQEKVALLAAEAMTLLENGAMRQARTGRGNRAISDDSVRGDFIRWIDETDEVVLTNPALREYFAGMEALRENFNRSLYLGLTEIESHFTIYPPGAFYRKHLDRFRGSEQRQVSSILYLNQGWSPEHGGQLRLYLDEANDATYLDIEPAGGTLVLFLSGRFWHEVLPATRQRMSLTGWFRTRA